MPLLAAKPIIDLLPLVRNINYIDEQTPMLKELGYKAWGEYGLAGRRYFTKDCGAYRTHNIHIYQADCSDGSRISVLIGTASLSDKGEGGICLVLDLSTRKYLENQLNKQTTDPERANTHIPLHYL